MKDLFEALALAQAEIKNPTKDRKVDMTLKSGRHVKYTYTDLAGVIDLTKPILAKHGLSIIQVPDIVIIDQGQRFVLKTILAHKSGESITSYYPLSETATTQELGSLITYSRRYSICSLLNIAGEEDDDGAVAEEVRRPVLPPFKAEQYFNQWTEQALEDFPVKQPTKSDIKNNILDSKVKGSEKFMVGKHTGKTFKEIFEKDIINEFAYAKWIKNQMGLNKNDSAMHPSLSGYFEFAKGMGAFGVEK